MRSVLWILAVSSWGCFPEKPLILFKCLNVLIAGLKNYLGAETTIPGSRVTLIHRASLQCVEVFDAPF